MQQLAGLGEGGDITGQGIHTDGSEWGFIACIDRWNVGGAETVLHKRLDGSKPLCKPRTLEAGDMLLFKDNKVYHQGWKFMNCSHCQELCQQASWLLIGCTRVNHQSEARSANLPDS